MAYYGRRGFIEALIEGGADIEATGKNSSRTALMVASLKGQSLTKIFSYLGNRSSEAIAKKLAQRLLRLTT